MDARRGIRTFRGLDFANYDKAAIEAGLLEVLKAETYVVVGPQIF